MDLLTEQYFKENTHRPVMWVTILFIAGILLGKYIAFSFCYLAISIAVVFLCVFLFFKNPRFSLIIIFISFIPLGIIYFQARAYLHLQHVQHIAKFYRNQDIEIKGLIISDVEKIPMFSKYKTSFKLAIAQVNTKFGWKDKKGQILVNVFKEADLNYGDLIIIKGKLSRPYNFSKNSNFSYTEYLANKGIYYVLSVKKSAEIIVVERGKGNFLKSISCGARKKLSEILAKYLTKNESGLMSAILLGDRTQISSHIRDLFVHTGTAHILAISGQNISLVAVLFIIILKILHIPRRVNFLITIVLLIFYAVLSGASPSVVRATIMSVIFIVSFIFEKQTDAYNTLSLSAFVILLISPFNLYDVGFQLSYISVISIIWLSPKIMRFLERVTGFQRSNKFSIYFFIMESFSISLSACIGVGGLIVYYFDIISPITIIANLMIVPLFGVVMILGIGLLISGFFPYLAGMFAVCLKMTLSLLIGIIFVLDKIPFAYFSFKVNSLNYILAYYLALVIIVNLPLIKKVIR